MKNYTVTPEFKAQVSTILATKKFSTVFPYMNLINREGFVYAEAELNSFVQFVGEFAYNEVAEFFQTLSQNCAEVTPATTEAPVKMEVVENEA